MHVHGWWQGDPRSTYTRASGRVVVKRAGVNGGTAGAREQGSFAPAVGVMRICGSGLEGRERGVSTAVGMDLPWGWELERGQICTVARGFSGVDITADWIHRRFTLGCPDSLEESHCFCSAVARSCNSDDDDDGA